MDTEDTETFKDVDLMLFDKVIAFDNFRQKIILIVNMSLDDPETRLQQGRVELQQLWRLLREGDEKAGPGGPAAGQSDSAV